VGGCVHPRRQGGLKTALYTLKTALYTLKAALYTLRLRRSQAIPGGMSEIAMTTATT